MKGGWEIKRLGEICEIIGGSTPKTNEPSYWDGEYYWVAPAELDGSKYISSTKRTITSSGVKNAHLQLLPSGTVLLSSRAPIGKVAITTVPMYCNQGFKNLVCSDKLNNEYAYWFLYNNTEYLNSLGTGATFKEISKKVVEQISIPVPPLPEQERIVAELDCLSSVIEKQKELLKELDNLAQSTFYTMFGDPISNNFRWQSNNIGTFATCIAGATPSTSIKEYWENGEIPWLSSGEVGKGRITDTEKKITKVGYDSCSTRMIPPHTIVIAMAGQGKTRGTVGVAEITLCTNQSICSIVCNDSINVDFLYYQLRFLYNELRSISNGDGGRGGLNLKLIQGFKVILPPLLLQQEFASKIEAIEKQKELIKQSITETETLFNSRMDYYFN